MRQRLDEAQLHIDAISSLLADLDQPDSQVHELIRVFLDKLASDADLPSSITSAALTALGVAERLHSHDEPFAETYLALCGHIDHLQRALYASMTRDANTAMPLDRESRESGTPDTPLTPEPRLPEPSLVAACSEPQQTQHTHSITSVSIDPKNPEFAAFVTETHEYLSAAEVALMALEKDPTNRESLNEVFRCFHNVKGISGFLGLQDFQHLAHAAESLMDLARSGRIAFASGPASVCFDALDLLKEMVGRVAGALQGVPYRTPDTYGLILERLKNTEIPAEPAEPLGSDYPAGAVQPPAITDTASETSPRARVDDFVKVSTTRLDSLIDAVGELVIAGSMVAQDISSHVSKSSRLAANAGRLGKIIRQLQELALGMRMVTLESTFHKMARVARDLSVKTGTPLDFSFSGEDTELDRAVVEEISSPLVHMVRNAIDHGIEPAEERKAKGKPLAGSIHLSAAHEGGSVVIRIRDDGRGLDKNRILSKAQSLGLVKIDADLTERDIYNLIFLPGFSTASRVTDVSGRGVGMDVVKKAVDRLRGRIEISTEPHNGTVFTIRLPLTMAIIDGMVITVGKKRYVVPTIAIQESLRPSQSQVKTVLHRGEMVSLRGRLLPLFRLHNLFGIPDAKHDPCDALILVISDGENSCALLVDDLIGQQQVVVKPVGTAFTSVRAVSGAAIMGDGLIALILDASGLIRMAREAS